MPVAAITALTGLAACLGTENAALTFYKEIHMLALTYFLIVYVHSVK